MGQTTSKLGLYLPGGGSTGVITPDEPADIDKINNNMSKIDADAGVKIVTSSTRPAMPYNGMLIYETDTKNTRVWRSSNSTWELVSLPQTVSVANGGTGATTVAQAQDNLGIGLVPVVPPTVRVSGGSATANSLGVIAFTAASSIQLDGVFTSAYSYYQILFNVSSATANSALFFRAATAGTQTTGALWYYGGYYWGVNGAGSATYISANADLQIGNVVSAGYNNIAMQAILDVNFQSGLKSPSVFSRSNDYPNGVGGTIKSARYNEATNAYDGFRITASSANITGTVQVLGYNS